MLTHGDIVMCSKERGKTGISTLLDTAGLVVLERHDLQYEDTSDCEELLPFVILVK